jgi:hypothetical protein
MNKPTRTHDVCNNQSCEICFMDHWQFMLYLEELTGCTSGVLIMYDQWLQDNGMSAVQKYGYWGSDDAWDDDIIALFVAAYRNGEIQ